MSTGGGHDLQRGVTCVTFSVAAACLEFVAGGNRYAGTVKGLLQRLDRQWSATSIERGDYWPKSPKGLADALRHAAPALRQLGVHVEIDSKPSAATCALAAAWSTGERSAICGYRPVTGIQQRCLAFQPAHQPANSL